MPYNLRSNKVAPVETSNTRSSKPNLQIVVENPVPRQSKRRMLTNYTQPVENYNTIMTMTPSVSSSKSSPPCIKSMYNLRKRERMVYSEEDFEYSDDSNDEDWEYSSEGEEDMDMDMDMDTSDDEMSMPSSPLRRSPRVNRRLRF